MMFVPAEPGSVTARIYGCTCPAQQARLNEDGTASYTRAEDCPLHRLPHALDGEHGFAQARRSEDSRERERQLA